jgi:ankyrin repeat protein
MSGHHHTPGCCPTEGPWCTKIDKYNCSSIRYVLINSYPESLCIFGLSQNIGTIHNTVNRHLLHDALRSEYADVVNLLLTHGYDINITEDNDTTALHLSVRYHKIKITELLIEHGANINALDGYNYTPVLYCCNREIRKYLLENGADVHIGRPWTSNSMLVAYGFPIIRRIHNLPLYLQDAVDGAFSRRKTAIRWWFYRHP